MTMSLYIKNRESQDYFHRLSVAYTPEFNLFGSGSSGLS